MDKKIAILVVSCDAYSDLWPIFFGLWNKYWPTCSHKIYLGANHKKFEHKDVNMINIGEDSDYSSNLIKMLNEIDEDRVIILCEDVFLSDFVDDSNLQTFYEEFESKDAAYLKLIKTYPLGYNKDISHKIASVPAGIKYRVGVGFALWNKDILLENIIPGQSAWEMEKSGLLGRNLKENQTYSINYHYLGSPPFTFVHGVIKGAWIRNSIKFLINEGFGNSLKKRPVLSMYDYIYMRLFGILMFIFKKTNFKWRL